MTITKKCITDTAMRTSLILLLIGIVLYSYEKPRIVVIPMHINLRTDLYKVLSVDTIYTDNINYKRVTYVKRKGKGK